MRTGLMQWLLVEVFYCLHVLTLTAYAIGSNELQKSLDLSSIQMGSLAAAFFVAFGLSQLFVGSQLGSRPNRWMIGG
jgi:sugar phosphate permease